MEKSNLTEQLRKLNQQLATFEEDKAKELEKIQSRIAMYELVLKHYPDARSCGPYGYLVGFRVELPEVKTVGDAIQLCEVSDPVSMSKWHHKGTTFGPTELIPEGCEDEQTISPYIVKVTGLAQYGTEVFLVWFSYIEDKLVEFRVRITGGEIRRTFERKNFKGGYRYENVQCVDGSGNFTRQVRWATGGSEYVNEFTLYF